MWTINRKSDNYEVVAADRMCDLPSFEEVRETSGFVGPDDDLVMVRPDGSVKAEDSAKTYRARKLGYSAYVTRNFFAPYQDEEIMGMIEGFEIGESIPILKAWNDGYTDAMLEVEYLDK